MATAEHDTQQEIATLTEAFQLFTQRTESLEKSYLSLKEQFKDVNLQLEQSHTKLNRKIKKLNHLTSYLNSILNHITQGLLFIRTNGVITTLSESAEKILHVDAETAVGHPYWDSFDDQFLGYSIRDTLATGSAPPTASVKLSNPCRQLEVTYTFVSEGCEEHQGLILLVKDITEIRRLQKITERNDRIKELGQMAATMAHEIRNPLGGIKGFAALLHRDLEGDEAKQGMAKHILDGSTSLDRLVRDILHYSRPVHTHPIATDLNALAQEAVDLFNMDQTKKEGVNLVLASEKSRVAFVDPDMVKSLLLNLIVNSNDAIDGDGTITLTTEEEDEGVIVTVHDTGKGIPKGDLEKIYSPFFTTKIYGNGFGLSEVFRTVQLHGGSIEVESKQGEGTLFTLSIPKVSAEVK